MKKTILLLIVLPAISLFAQSKYEVLLSRPDITGLTGGTATDLDGIPTTGLAEGTMVAVFDGTETRIYRLTTGTNPENSPGVIRPDDFADPGNTKVWIASLSSDPEETGYTPSGGGGTTYSVGDFAQGGVVFWVDETGQHGLVCAKVDQSAGVRWYAGTYGVTRATGDGPFSGELNTSIIISSQVSIGDDGADYAAQICNDLQVTEGGKTYGDWYLPSKEELNLMYQNKATIDVTAVANGGSGFAGPTYWSSTESYNNYAWLQNFSDGNQYYNGYKDYTVRVRAVRRF
jgi:hypothetical protein